MSTKQKCMMIFNTKVQKVEFSMDNAILEHASKYKYLGIILSRNGSFKAAISALANQSNEALFPLIMKVSIALSFPPPPVMCYLFDSLIKHITEYGAEIWGHRYLLTILN